MHRDGHFGIVLLALAPVLFVLLSSGRPFLALLACGVIVIEPLPDNDFWVPGLSHRGTSHSLFAAGVIGGCCAGIGWVGGTYFTVPLTDWLTTAVLPVVDIEVLRWVTVHLSVLDVGTVTVVGLFVGVGGICLHLVGDIITVAGIRPFLPFSRRRASLSSLRAANTVVNGGLFVLGVLAIVAVGIVVTPLADLLFALF